MKVKMIDFGGKMPERAHYNDAGLDCFANEDYWLCAINKGDTNRKRIKLGFGIELPDGYVAFLLPRSSLSAKGIRVEIGTIDSGYRGEIQAIVVNDTHDIFEISKGMKIAQLVVMPVTYVEPVLDLSNDRLTGGFGSTGK